MSMMCYLADLTAGQIAAFREHPGLASDFAELSALDRLDARAKAGMARLPPDMRQQYERAQQDLMAQEPSLRERRAKQDDARLRLAKLEPFEAILELGKTWHILHYLMTGHVDASPAPGDALLSGAPLGEDLGYGPPRLHDAGATRAFRDFLGSIEADRLIARIDFAQLVQLRVYPLAQVPDAADAQAWREDVARSFQSLKSYVGRAAERGDGLLIWLS